MGVRLNKSRPEVETVWGPLTARMTGQAAAPAPPPTTPRPTWVRLPVCAEADGTLGWRWEVVARLRLEAKSLRASGPAEVGGGGGDNGDLKTLGLTRGLKVPRSGHASVLVRALEVVLRRSQPS